MGTDYRLYTATASLDLDVRGRELFNALKGSVQRPGVIRKGTLEALPGFDRKQPFWKGVWCFLRDHGDGEGMVVSEHSDCYDIFYERVEGGPSHHFSVSSHKGHHKRLGYGPL